MAVTVITSSVSSITMTIVTIAGLSIGRSLAVAVAVTVTASVVTIAGLSIGRSLAVVTVMSIGVRRSVPVSVSAVSVAVSVVTIAGLSSGGGLSISLSLRLSISGPLAVVPMVAIAIAAIASV